MSVCDLSSSRPLHYVSFSNLRLYFLAHLYYYFNCLWIHINSTSEHMPVPIYLSHPFLYSVPHPVFSQNFTSWNSLLLFFCSFWADLVIITKLTGKDPSLVERSDPKLITMVTIFLIIFQLYFPAFTDSGRSNISEEEWFPLSPTSSPNHTLCWEPKMCSNDI